MPQGRPQPERHCEAEDFQSAPGGVARSRFDFDRLPSGGSNSSRALTEDAGSRITVELTWIAATPLSHLRGSSEQGSHRPWKIRGTGVRYDAKSLIRLSTN